MVQFDQNAAQRPSKCRWHGRIQFLKYSRQWNSQRVIDVTCPFRSIEKINDKLFTSLSFMNAGWASSSFASPLSTMWNVIVPKLIHSVRDNIIIVWSDVYAIYPNAKLCVFQWRRLAVAKHSFLLLCSRILKPIGRATTELHCGWAMNKWNVSNLKTITH